MSDDERGVRRANERFYAAMNALDISEMDDVWLDDGSAVCVHPGREAIFGYERIRESWLAIFSATDSMTILPRGERVTLWGDIAWVVCTEIISMTTEEGLAAAAAQATNIFRRASAGDEWRMIVHHASPVPFIAEDEWPDVIN
ncbi:MAG TPA: nuclear transport factor 2 family protein [Pyrinomonadaceae bacterium]|jgi:uncharacterized protein (TIGR02246 family)|nr:nuclear transport factor 2 family protein [Pyrinomonadaceae bacterium]